MLRANTHNNQWLQDNFNEFGEDNLIFEIIHRFGDLQDSIDCEQAYIDNNGIEKYNISNSSVCGGDIFTHNPRKEDLRNMRRNQMSGEGNHQYGKPKTKKMIESVKKSNSKPIVVDGVEYESISEFSATSGVKHTTVSYRLNSDTFKNYKYKSS